MKVFITGADGFIGLNLRTRLAEIGGFEVVGVNRQSTEQELKQAIDEADFCFHLAGVNRPQDPADFKPGNVSFLEKVLSLVALRDRVLPVVFTSSTQALQNNPYGESKREAEDLLMSANNVSSFIFRLPNVFGKWSKPNYNSAIATFCHNLNRGLPIQIHDPSAKLNLVYIDDVIESFLSILMSFRGASNSIRSPGFVEVNPVYQTTVGEVAEILKKFSTAKQELVTDDVGVGLKRALYATYISFFETKDFSYVVPRHEDPRGVFVEMLKTNSAGQFSFFSAHPGVTRGGHYHHTKTEKFLVLTGKALFRFRHIITGEKYELVVDGDRESRIVETIPGWSHNIKNIGDAKMLCMLWANEVFDRNKPDTIGKEVY